MKIDFSAVLTDLDDKPLRESADDEALTLGAAAVRALMNIYPGEENLSGTKKADRFVLASKIHKQTVVEIRSDEAALIKELIGKAYGPVVVGRAFPLLD